MVPVELVLSREEMSALKILFDNGATYITRIDDSGYKTELIWSYDEPRNLEDGTIEFGYFSGNLPDNMFRFLEKGVYVKIFEILRKGINIKWD